MTRLIWDAPKKKMYEMGLDRGVLYLPDSTGVPWNGLVSFDESYSREGESVYYEGVKIHEHVALSEFTATLTAVTYPSEFEELEGTKLINCGATIGEQAPKRFGLSYRSLIGNDVSGLNHYKLHILYNLMAVPDNKNYETISDDVSIMDFSWRISAIPEVLPGYRPSARVTIDSRKADPLLLKAVEDIFYGGIYNNAYQLSMQDLVTMLNDFYRLRITVHEDLTWTADDPYDAHISIGEDGYFEITSISAIELSEDEYTIEDLNCLGPEMLWLEVVDNGDLTWTGNSPYDNVISVNEETGLFSINGVEPTLLGDGYYRLEDTFIEQY